MSKATFSQGVKEHKKKKERLDRRLGKDGTRITQDFTIYRWFFVFLKCALELEGQTFKLDGKTHKVKFNRNHKWWKLIDLKTIPKNPKFIRFNYHKLQSQIGRLFHQSFLPRYRDLFLERTTIFDVSFDKVPSDYISIHIPPNYPIKSILSDIKNYYDDKNIVFKGGRNISRYTANIVPLHSSNEITMKRLFNTLSISQSSKKLTHLQVYFEVEKRRNKSFKIPIITRHSSTGKKGFNKQGTMTSDRFDSKMRMTQRDTREVQRIIINLCNGIFPKRDKII